MVTTEDILSIIAATEDLSVSASKLENDVPLVTQGFDSLDMATLMLAVEAKYKKAIPLEKAARLRTLKDIADYLNG